MTDLNTAILALPGIQIALNQNIDTGREQVRENKIRIFKCKVIYIQCYFL